MKNHASTLTTKGQVTIPSYIRNKLHLEAGQRLEFFIQEESFVVIPINRSLKSLKGILPKPKSSLSIEEMNNVIRESYDRN